MTETINIVGGGLAGSILARAITDGTSYNVQVIDDRDRFSASQASSNLYISSWLKKFNSHETRTGLELLEKLFGAHKDQPFETGIAEAAKVNHLAQKRVLWAAPTLGQVQMVDRDGLILYDGQSFSGPTVLCIGHRANAIRGIKHPPVHIKVGHAVFFRGTLPKGKSTLRIISPFRHEKLYQYDTNIIYYADSVAVKYETYKKRNMEYQAKTLERARGHIGYEPEQIDFRIGYRPMMSNHDFGFMGPLRIGSTLSNRVWGLNGGGKNGMVAYAYHAAKFVNTLRDEGLSGVFA